MNNYSLNKSKY